MAASNASRSKKPFFIGIDSDGTVFDSMEIKHKRVFQPVAIELFKFSPEVADAYCSIAEAINLYSTDRGINRFLGLALAFTRLRATGEPAASALAGAEDLDAFVASGGPYSFAALAEYTASRPSPFLARVLEWSRRSDALYEEIMESEGTPRFPGVLEILSRAFEQAEIVVISSSSRVTLEQDWGKAGLLPVVDRIEGQEQGSKSTQLRSSLGTWRQPTAALMLGDALGDLEAADAQGILFYPIIPGQEAACWERFGVEGLPRFFAGTFAGDYAGQLRASFEAALAG